MNISIPVLSHAQLHGGGFEAGFFHPVLGFDHLLAMVAVGIVSTLLGGRAIYIVPLSFVVVMFIGSVFGFSNITFFNDELGIAISVILLGLAIAMDRKIPLVVAMVFVSFFAFFHGHAHGLEIPSMSSVYKYASGFIVATIGLHVSGVIIGLVGEKFKHGRHVLRHIGSAIMGIGIYILFELLR